MKSAKSVSWAWVSAVVGVLGLVVVAVLAAVAGGAPYTAVGGVDPGVLVHVGTPVLRAVAEGAATLCAGALAYAAGLARRRTDGALAADGYAAVRAAGRWAWLWLVASLALVPFDVSDQSGQPMSRMFGLLGALEEPRAWLVTAGAALLVALGCRAALRWGPAVGLLVLAVFGLLPPLVTGHSSSDAGHDLATAAILVHVPVAAIWLGCLVQVVLRRDADRRKYRRLATGCWLVLAVSGLVDAAVLARPVAADGYDLLLAGKIVLVAALGALGWALRKRLARTALAVAELAVLGATMAVSVGLAHLVPPTFSRPVTADQTLLGYDLAPPTFARYVLDWRPDLLFGPAAVLLAAWYLVRGRAKPVGQKLSWLAGCLVLLLVTCSGLNRYAPAMFSAHLASHMLLSMLVPLLLALGGPFELLRSPRLRALAGSRAARALTQPAVVLVLFAGAPFALYFTGLYDAAVRFHWAHQAITLVFLLIGYLFCWAVLGADPTPRPLPNLARLGLVLATMPFDTVFGALVVGSHQVIGNGPGGDNMYTALALPWVPDLLADQRLAGVLALAISELVLFGALAALLLRWQRVDRLDLPEFDLPGLTGRGEPAQPQAVGHHEQG